MGFSCFRIPSLFGSSRKKGKERSQRIPFNFSEKNNAFVSADPSGAAWGGFSACGEISLSAGSICAKATPCRRARPRINMAYPARRSLRVRCRWPQSPFDGHGKGRSRTVVAPQLPPAPTLNSTTPGWRSNCARTCSRSVPMPLPWMIRTS